MLEFTRVVAIWYRSLLGKWFVLPCEFYGPSMDNIRNHEGWVAILLETIPV